jgi:hypothetical protein
MTDQIEVTGGVNEDMMRGDQTRSDVWTPVDYRLKLKLRVSN